MKVPLPLLLCLGLLPSLSLAQPAKTQCEPPKQGIQVNGLDQVLPVMDCLVDAPVFDIKIYQKGSYAKTSREPYAAFRPEPFYYRADLDAAKAKGVQPFKVAGVNCDNAIQNASTITGVTVENLSLRARGRGSWYLRSDSDPVRPFEPEWRGSPRFDLRGSADGFLKGTFPPENAQELRAQKEEFRELLLVDNRSARKAGLSHSQIAAPILSAIERNMGGISTEFVFQGEHYRVIAYGDDQKYFGDARHPVGVEGSKQDSGWVGNSGIWHVQGSFFDDELATRGLYYRFIRKHPKKGEENELTIDGLTPHLIHRYGFYQGGEYRVAPQQIAKFFRIKPSRPNVWKDCK